MSDVLYELWEVRPVTAKVLEYHKRYPRRGVVVDEEKGTMAIRACDFMDSYGHVRDRGDVIGIDRERIERTRDFMQRTGWEGIVYEVREVRRDDVL